MSACVLAVLTDRERLSSIRWRRSAPGFNPNLWCTGRIPPLREAAVGGGWVVLDGPAPPESGRTLDSATLREFAVLRRCMMAEI